MANKSVGEVVANVGLHGGQLGSRHGVDGSPGGSCAGLQRNIEVVLAMRGKSVGLVFREDIQEVMVSFWNLC